MNHRSRVSHMLLGLDRIGYLLPALRQAPDILDAHKPQARIASPNWNAGGSRGADHTSSTERHALNPDPEQQLADQLFTAWKQMMQAIEHCIQAMDRLNSAPAHIDRDDPGKLRSSTLPPPCECCGDTSLRIEGGLCAERCAPSWRAYRAAQRHPDRTRWLTERRKRLAQPAQESA